MLGGRGTVETEGRPLLRRRSTTRTGGEESSVVSMMQHIVASCLFFQAVVLRCCDLWRFDRLVDFLFSSSSSSSVRFWFLRLTMDQETGWMVLLKSRYPTVN